MAHALYGYDGPCRNIHGHSYELSLTVSGKPLRDPGHPKAGMVMDFSVLRSIAEERVLKHFDHALVVNGLSPHREIKNNGGLFEKLISVDYQPTCENLLLDFVERIRPNLPEGVSLHHMTLKETASSYAEWFAEDNNA